MDRSQATSESNISALPQFLPIAAGLATQRARLAKDLENVNQLEDKIEKEMATLQDRMAKMTADIQTYGCGAQSNGITAAQLRTAISTRPRRRLRRSSCSWARTSSSRRSGRSA